MRSPQEELTHLAYQAHLAGQQLTTAGPLARTRLLHTMAGLAKQSQDQVLEANTFDLVAGREMAVPELVWEWLKLTPDRWQSVVTLLEKLASTPDPLTMAKNTQERPIPLGVIAFVYEGLGQLGMVATAMALRSGNSILLKGGNETSHTQQAIANLIKVALSQNGLSEYSLVTAPQGAGVKELLSQDRYIRLLVPYGRPSFVQQLCKQATVSVLPTAIGNCCLFIGVSGSLDIAKQMILDSHRHEPDPVVAIEKVIIHQAWLGQPELLVQWLIELQSLGFTVRGCDCTTAFWRQYAPEPELESVAKWEQTDLDGSIAIKIAENTEEAIALINQYSSGHADCAVTDSLQDVQLLADKIHSSTLTFNHIFPFERIGDRVLLGMSSSKMRGAYCHTGVIDVNTFTARKRIILG